MKKMLLMGSEGVGKTSMYRVIFANLPAKQTYKIGYTVSKQQHRITIMGNIYLDLWDCGSQNEFMKEYFNAKRQSIFSMTALLLYVFQLEQSEEKFQHSLENFRESIKNIKRYSNYADIFVLIHKIDLVPDELQRRNKIMIKKQHINKQLQTVQLKAKGFFSITIWDESLYYAWAIIIQSQVPNRQFLKQTLGKLCQACNCSEVILFQKETFLILSHYSLKKQEDLLQYERMATLLKTFKITCCKAGAKMAEVEFSTSYFSGIILPLTHTENVMLLSDSNQTLNKKVCSLNVSNVGKYLESLRVQR